MKVYRDHCQRQPAARQPGQEPGQNRLGERLSCGDVSGPGYIYGVRACNPRSRAGHSAPRTLPRSFILQPPRQTGLEMLQVGLQYQTPY